MKLLETTDTQTVRTRLRIAFTTLALAVMVCAMLPATAGANLMGSTLSWEYTYTLPNGTIGYDIKGTFIDDGVNHVTLLQAPYWEPYDILADGSSVTISGRNIPEHSAYTAMYYSTLTISVVHGPQLSSVVLDPATNVGGFDMSKFQFTNTEIVAILGPGTYPSYLTFDRDSVIKFDVTTVPEPSGMLLIGFGLAGLIALRRMHFAE